MATAKEKADIQGLRFHELCHTYVSNARKAGIERSVFRKLTGHQTLSMFTRYNTVDQADAEEAMQRLEDFFGRNNSSAAIVLQEEKKSQEKSPNP